MAFADLRAYLVALEGAGELQRVTAEVDCRNEVGALTRRVLDLRERAPLFENLKGYPGGRLFACPTGPSKPNLHGRMAVALGLPRGTSALDQIEFVRERIREPIAPRTVPTGPCKENVQRADAVDLTRFPVPWVHELDGGPYIGTWAICITKDPDTGWVNWGMYRMMLHDARRVNILFHPVRQHGGGIFFEKYERRGEPMPVAIAIGTDPISTIVAATDFDAQTSEVTMAGAISGAPIDLVRCETVDLEVPATSEIVIEGLVHPGARLPEGPFGEYTGYAVHADASPFVEVSCVTHRNDPIMTMTNMGKPWDECHVLSSITKSAMAKQRLEEAGVETRAVYIHAPTMSMVVSARETPGLAERVIEANKRVSLKPYTVIVGEDIDPTDLEQVWWAITTRMHPRDGYSVIPDRPANTLIPWIHPEERASRRTVAACLDATFPAAWPADYREQHTRVVDFEHAWSQAQRDLVLRRWNEYGYEPATSEPR